MADKYYRLVCFVVDICADVLRKYFVKLSKTDAGNTYTSVDAYLSHRKRDVIQLFNNKKLRRDQYDLLYPVNGTADENQWDVSILVTLISELFVTRLQPLVIVALKTEIRGIRNELQHHPNTGKISDDDFDDYWGRLDDSVRLIAKNALDPNDQASLLEKINQVKCNHLPNLSDCFRIWHEETSKQLLNVMNEVQVNAEETTSILRQVTVQKPGPSGDKDKRIKVADDILTRLQAGFESTMKELSDDFNPPSEMTDIRAKLRDCHHVVVTGCNNSRYFETALEAVKGMDYNYKRSVEMHTSSDWRHIDPKDVDLVLCRDPFGGFSYDESKAKAMGDIFKSIMNSTKRNNGDKALDIVIVTDFEILEECKLHHDHELLDEVVKVFTKTSSAQPADLTIGCGRQNHYVQPSLLSVSKTLEVMTENFLSEYQVFSLQVDANVLKTAKEKFKTCKAIVLTGPKKCGKTSIAVALTSAYETAQCLLLNKPNNIIYIDFKNICLVIIDEFAGKYRYDKNEVCEWYETFDHLYRAVIARNLNVVITCEKGKLEKCINEIGRHAILDHVVEVPLQTTVVKLEVTEQPLEYKEDSQIVKFKEGFVMSYDSGEGTSYEGSGASGSSIPNLHQLVSSGVDMLLEADSKGNVQPIVGGLDNVQEILAAATTFLANGGDAVALEKISIEQFIRLGEVSKMKLAISQSDRKRRKRRKEDVSGILYVFLCNWCEKVYLTKVDLFQHFLIIHQGKLLSGEEYGARKHTQPAEKLQQEIEYLEKKVLGFTPDNYQVM